MKSIKTKLSQYQFEILMAALIPEYSYQQGVVPLTKEKGYVETILSLVSRHGKIHESKYSGLPHYIQPSKEEKSLHYHLFESVFEYWENKSRIELREGDARVYIQKTDDCWFCSSLKIDSSPVLSYVISSLSFFEYTMNEKELINVPVQFSKGVDLTVEAVGMSQVAKV